MEFARHQEVNLCPGPQVCVTLGTQACVSCLFLLSRFSSHYIEKDLSILQHVTRENTRPLTDGQTDTAPTDSVKVSEPSVAR
jgi:hypothetical protein